MQELATLFYGLALGVLFGELLSHFILILPQWLAWSWRQHCACSCDSPVESTGSQSSKLIRLLFTMRPSCPNCEYRFQGYRRIALLSWVLHADQCPQCGLRLRDATLIPQLVTVPLTVVVLLRGGFEFRTLFILAECWGWVAIAFISIRHQLIPDALSYALLWLGLLAGLFDIFVSLNQAVLGAATGYLLPWAIYHFVRIVRNRELLGYGVFKSGAAMGAVLGPAGVAIALGCAILLKLVENLVRHRRLVTETGLLPMGHWLAGVAMVPGILGVA